MVFNTATVGSAVTPAVIQTLLSHYLNRKPLAQKPTAHISYDEGLHLIRKFLLYASHHTVEDIQRFTSQWVPHPRWVKVDEVKISEEHITKAAEYIQRQLGRRGIENVGGKTWWQWRRPGSELKAEWIEMRADYQERKRNKDNGKRVMLYVHGGAYFFGSVDEHRYQMQRHARKLKARVFARLAPQFPFPCGLHDCMAAYLSLLATQDPTTIILAGDSAGGGMVVSMLVLMRDQGIPLPAGAILISPWVDLTHSFPSVATDNPLDYIPPHGFHQRPSPSWPPPTTDDMLTMQEEFVKKIVSKEHNLNRQQSEADAVQGFHVDHNPNPATQNATAATEMAAKGDSRAVANTVPGCGRELSIIIGGNLVEIKDQIHMYTSNQLISHPLVSPILQPSLGGLPPLLILTGGGEMLRDEQIYLAHKAANPTKYPPGDAFLDASPNDHSRDQIKLWKPTDVQLQVWEDLCHVAPTLSFTRPAKYMYRSIAQFGAWALARAQDTEIEILDDDDVSIISQSTDSEEDDKSAEQKKKPAAHQEQSGGQVGKAGDPLPPFRNHMIRQRVDRHGSIFPLEPAHHLPACSIQASEIGVIKEGPVRKWMAAKREWDTKYASAKRRVQKQRAREMAKGYQEFGDGEVPPPSALAGRRRLGEDLTEEKKKRSTGMSLWSLWGSKHDEKTIELEQAADRQRDTITATATDGAGARPLDDTKADQRTLIDRETKAEYSRSRSRRRTVTDQHQTESGLVDENTPASELLAIKRTKGESAVPEDGHLTPDFMTKDKDPIPSILILTPTADESELKRPKAGGIAFPFSLKQDGTNASMITLTSAEGITPADAMSVADLDGNSVKQNTEEFEIANGEGDRSEEAEVLKENGKPVDDTSKVVKEHTNGIAGVDKGKAVTNCHNAPGEKPPLKSFQVGTDGLLAADHGVKL